MVKMKFRFDFFFFSYTKMYADLPADDIESRMPNRSRSRSSSIPKSSVFFFSPGPPDPKHSSSICEILNSLMLESLNSTHSSLSLPSSRTYFFDLLGSFLLMLM